MKSHQPIIINRPVKSASKVREKLTSSQSVTKVSQPSQKVRKGGCCLRGKA